MKHTSNAARGAALRRPLAVLVAAAGLAVAGCATSPNNAPGAQSAAPAPPAASATPPVEPQAATLNWASSMCQALHPVFGKLGAPPKINFGDLATTRQAYINYLGNARQATQQAIDLLPSVGAPPVPNGQQMLDQMRNQLSESRKDLDGALAQLNQADPRDSVATGLAIGGAGTVLGALGNRVQVPGNLAPDPQLRAAINQTPECQNLIGANTTAATNQPTGSSPPPS
ncbi:MAG TPA: hypothetical protein VFW64_17530 [Pseudonocardiaceae bacterium]|nr:hypothetical protein [Pseudonocardiaceae bacterium]